MRSTRVLMITAALLTALIWAGFQKNGTISIASAAQQAGETMTLLKPAKLHSEASISSPVTEIVWKNAFCQRLDQKGNWIQVRMALDGHTGWIHHQYLIPASAEATEQPPAQTDNNPPSQAVATAPQPEGLQLKLNKPAKLHEAAAIGSPVLEIIAKDEICTRLDEQGVWIHVLINRTSHQGWIHRLYLISATAEAAMQNSTPTVEQTATDSKAPAADRKESTATEAAIAVTTAAAPASETPATPEPVTSTPPAAAQPPTTVQAATTPPPATEAAPSAVQPTPIQNSTPPVEQAAPATDSKAPAAERKESTAAEAALALTTAAPPATEAPATPEPATSTPPAAAQPPATETAPSAVPPKPQSPAAGSHSAASEPELSHAHIDVTDRNQIRRGLTVFTDICMGCHSAKYLTWRGLIEYPEIGLSSEEVAELRGRSPVMQGLISDLPTEDAIAAYGKAPPDLSLIVAGRRGGADYVYSLLTGYAHDPARRIADPAYNPVYPGHRIAMPDPLSWLDHSSDDEPALRRQAEDVAAFLAFIADPHQNTRRSLGVWVVSFLLLFTFVLWLLKIEIWKDVKPTAPKQGLIARMRSRSGTKKEAP